MPSGTILSPQFVTKLIHGKFAKLAKFESVNNGGALFTIALVEYGLLLPMPRVW